jgi:hypothetical protein
MAHLGETPPLLNSHKKFTSPWRCTRPVRRAAEFHDQRRSFPTQALIIVN